MRFAAGRPVPEQRIRLVSALLYGAALIVVSYWLTGNWAQPFGLKGLWFYTALVGLLLGRALVEPYFTRPADAAVNSVALALTVIAVSRADTAIDHRNFVWGRVALLGYAAVVGLLSVVAIMCEDAVPLRRLAGWCSTQTGRIGRADVVNGQQDLPTHGQETSPLAAREFPTGGQKISPRMAKHSPPAAKRIPHRWSGVLGLTGVR